MKLGQLLLLLDALFSAFRRHSKISVLPRDSVVLGVANALGESKTVEVLHDTPGTVRGSQGSRGSFLLSG